MTADDHDHDVMLWQPVMRMFDHLTIVTKRITEFDLVFRTLLRDTFSLTQRHGRLVKSGQSRGSRRMELPTSADMRSTSERLEAASRSTA